ncbi:tyrosine-type recombinase/integrase [Mesoterricola silvestris]|uniref:Tyr recombinase domain-containing protein n=1 Tax=Mesoterricola silvestris TaxID=2927979 RepID=A0AA48K9C2_9BACT|nr:tyrosine-type recombinase/integrase [Mesoterricola silvestris]BDU72950.1 hypothetical protein METEAL_21240 [Mesoterricola silvestris]
MARRAKAWFTEDGRPIMHDGIYKNTPGGDFLFDFRCCGQHKKGSTGTPIEDLARAHVAQLKRQITDAFYGRTPPEPVKPKVYTLFEVWEEWEKKKTSSVSKSHVRWMKGVVVHHTHEWKDLPITELEGAAISTLKDRYMSGTGKGFKKGEGHTVRTHSGGGWNKVLVQLRALVGFAQSEGMIQDRTFSAKGNWLKPASKAPGFLWPEQVQKFLAPIDTMRKNCKGDRFCHPGIYIRLMLGVGLREGEAINLEWERVNWRQNVIVIADARATDWRPKDREVREIEMPAWLRTYLLQWWEFCERPSKGLVMVSRHGGAHREGISKRAIEKGAAELGIVGLHPHLLRATFATTQWEIGATLDEIAAMLGHDDPEITLKHYIRRRPKGQTVNQAKAAERMGFTNPQIVPA